ncbi:unnamed protein product, partial [Brassica rapa]
EEQKHTRRLNGTAFRELTKSLVYNILVLATVLFLLQVVLLAIREDWTRLDLLYMGLESQNCHLSPVDVVEKAWEKISCLPVVVMMMICSAGSFSRIKRK